jgi:hypothetical protein
VARRLGNADPDLSSHRRPTALVKERIDSGRSPFEAEDDPRPAFEEWGEAALPTRHQKVAVVRFHTLVEGDQVCPAIHDHQLYNLPLKYLYEARDDPRLIAFSTQNN